MASKIKLLRAGTLEELESAINQLFLQMQDDARIEVDLVGGITYAKGEYVAPVRVRASHKRSFEDGE